jgi:hypothetical protein
MTVITNQKGTKIWKLTRVLSGVHNTHTVLQLLLKTEPVVSTMMAKSDGLLWVTLRYFRATRTLNQPKPVPGPRVRVFQGWGKAFLGQTGQKT